MRKGRVMTDGAAGLITRVEELAYELKIEEVMTEDVKSVKPNQTIEDVLELFRQAGISGAPVVSHGEIVGIISNEDLIRSLRENHIDAAVRDYMSPEVVTVVSCSPLIESLKLFSKLGLGRLPVVDEDGGLAGIITNGDVTRGLLRALQTDYQAEEVIRYRASHLFEDIVSDRTGVILRYFVKARDFTHGGVASSNTKRALLRLGASKQLARRCGIALYEAEMNLIIHATTGGVIRVEIEPHVITMKAVDNGPGIADVQQAMKPGFSTAPPEVREMGFGAGMGLKNIARCVDKMSLKSSVGKGTRLEMKIYLHPREVLREKPGTRAEKEQTA
jgi:CBS domain-containing protein/anti-sigma regulatory factor (Ser/Thr protein kinase)